MNLNRLVDKTVDRLWGNSLEENMRDQQYSAPQNPTSVSSFLEGVFYGEAINFYPGIKTNKCHEFAVFLSVTKAPPGAEWMKKKEMIPLEKMLVKVIQHMQGMCHGKTKHMALIIDDNLSMKTLSEWKSNLRHIQNVDKKEVKILYVDSEGKKHDLNKQCGLSKH